MRGIFVTGTDTDVGKTWVCAALLAGAPAAWRYWKPVQTGLADAVGDTATVRRRARLTPEQAPDVGTRLDVAASPHHAARLAGRRITVASILSAAPVAGAPGPFWVVEGAGGLLVPLNDRETMLDLIRALRLPVVVVVRVRLGAINHALLTERTLRRARVPALGHLLSGEEDPALTSALRAHGHLPVLGRLPELAASAPLQPLGEALRAAVAERLP